MRVLLIAAATFALSLSTCPASAHPQEQSPAPLITRIEFAGLRRISREALRARIASRVGQPLDRTKLESDVRALDRLEWFDAVRVELFVADPPREESGVRVVFRLEERPFLAGVEFRGSGALTADKIKKMLGERRIVLKIAAPISRAELWRASRIIQESLADLGHSEARVRARLIAVPTAAVRAIFEIEDGPRITAGRVTFTGVHAFPEKTLRRAMHRVSPGVLFADLRDKNIYTVQRLAEDLDRLENFYRDHGFPEARLGRPEVQVVQEPVLHGFLWMRRSRAPRFHIVIPVLEGMAYRFGGVRVDAEALPLNLGEKITGLPEIHVLEAGGPYSQEKLMRAREGVTQLLARTRAPSSSKLSPGVDVGLKTDPEAATVQVTLRIHETHPYIVRRLEFSGQRRFSDRYYRRHAGLQEGDPFDPQKIESGLTQVARLGYIHPLKKEDVAVRLDEARHTADISIHVDEVGRQKISLVGGHAALGSTIGIIYNVFDVLGGEELITGHLEGGPDIVQALISVAKESVFGSRVSLGLSVFQNIVRPNLPAAGRREHLFTSRSAGITLATTAPVSPADTLGATYSLSHAGTRYHLALPPSISGLVNPSLGTSATTSALGWQWTHDAARDRFTLDSSVSGGWLGGTKNQIRGSADYARLLPDPFTEKRNTWAIRWAVSGAANYHGDLVFEDRLFGGDEYVRGFRTGELSPYALVTSHTATGSDTFSAQTPGANLIGALNAEYRAPIAPRTELAGFFDTGSGWLLPGWLGPNRPTLLAGTNGAWRASTGVEVRWQIPEIGQKIRVHFALNPLRLAEGLLLPDGSRFHPPDRLFAVGWALGSPF